MAETSQSGSNNMHTLVHFFVGLYASKGYPFKNMFNFTTPGDSGCVAAVERRPALHYSVYIICPLGSRVSLWNFETIRSSLMRPKLPKLACLAMKICTL